MCVCLNECVYIKLYVCTGLECERHFISKFNSVDRACAVPYNYRLRAFVRVRVRVRAHVCMCVCVCMRLAIPKRQGRPVPVNMPPLQSAWSLIVGD